ncbi:antibiotic biosynthesis monooxygenase [Flavobacterium sp. ANB]|uniref:putative quinol monooxygenase n=1 Tax=unclassified Flavobacterium TaxID=196869 RepID=UPI0012B9799B|nr:MULTISPECIES: putative quinol monooxygenase [unclassified Flavobacterium]MBF4516870.1 antibiotic biosynthesis monooxygenase [Flavobacterium sp. ANB]MTD69234.1 antibiotic biosynthesis monooxygenase [Flavobacterium sp. LC2016-13]
MEKELIVKWKIKETETNEILKFLPALAEKTKNEKGNTYYAIYQSESNPNELILHERYVDEHAVQAHKDSEHYQEIVVGKILPHLENREVLVVNKLV